MVRKGLHEKLLNSTEYLPKSQPAPEKETVSLLEMGNAASETPSGSRSVRVEIAAAAAGQEKGRE